ncbi:scarecrow-like protein 8 isoform X2 [Morus notabilis]|uniref:scarecrow-like protein 8 isoform X1 n=1 Tax=Morus notabilis TaxID=981085 RepID=UPI000CED52E4|nr:scarecrow-like protein 8 isoform X1 [Morus notabilis]XP_024021654.1 scarecrow-like protein 8 isoform X2 [Morus notabilis]
MQSGFTGGGGGLPDLYAATGRSIAAAMNNNPSQPPYGSRPNLPGLFLDPTTSRIARHNPATTMIGKRTLAEFQSHQQYMPAQVNYLRSVKPRAYQHSSPISPLSPIEFSPTTTAASETSYSSLLSSQRFGLPILQQLRPQPSTPAMQGAAYVNSAVQNRIPAVDSDKKMINHRLQELEKQLLDDNDEEEGDPVSAITNNSNSEWSETIQNLISPNQSQKPVSPSPTSSSSSSSSSVASPATTTCSKQSLMEAATAISEGKTDVASEILTRQGQVLNPRPNSEQRVLEFVASALKSRVNPVENPPPVIELFSLEHTAAVQSLHDLSPCFSLGLMAANLAIIEATLPDKPVSKGNKVHVIDFDIGQGGQYVSLLRALVARHQNGKPPVGVKITTLADTNGGRERLNAVGEKLRQLAEGLGIVLEFNVVSLKIGEVSRESLGCEADEPLAVNFAFKLYRTPDESVSTENPRDELLRRVKAMGPRVVVLVEQELNTNTAPFMARLNETCAYYGALLDSIESTTARDNSERVKAVEEALSRKLGNSVACEGRDRVERCEVFGKWRARMGMAGFELKPLSQSVKTRLSSNRVPPGFTVKEENGGVCFGWMGRTLTVASTWR